MIEHSLGAAALSILESLAKPTRLEDIVKVFSEEKGFDAVNEIESLEKKGLVFHEGERFFSLVLENKNEKQIASTMPYAIGDARHAAKALYGSTV